jgi:hypothetical protein
MFEIAVTYRAELIIRVNIMQSTSVKKPGLVISAFKSPLFRVLVFANIACSCAGSLRETGVHF